MKLMKPVTLVATLVAVLIAGPAAARQTQTPATPAPRPTAPAPQTPTPSPPAVPVPFPADAKIAFVNMQLIVNDSKLGKTGQDQMKKLADTKAAEQTTLNKQIQTLQTELQTQGSVLAAAVVQSKTAELDKLQRQAQFNQQQAQVDVDNLQQRLFDDFTDKVLPIIEEIRAEKGLWVVFAAGEGTGVAALHKGLDLSATVDPAIPHALVGDPTRLRQVLVNLLGNAVKFTDRGEVMLRVAAAATPGLLLRFEVRDTGIGIADQQLDTVFDAFMQGDTSSTRRHGGSGLGLTIAQTFVAQHGGNIECDSVPGRTVFTILLPLESMRTAG
jgi:signal transduction histidine kinase